MKNKYGFILVEPQLGENIGSVARSLKNFGFNNLIITNPKYGWPNVKAKATSVGAFDILTKTKVCHNTISAISLTTKEGATKAMSVIDGASLMISGIRSNMGSANNRLQSTIDNLSNIAVNAQKSLSTIEDANFAEETAKLTKAQILAKAATSMLAQANKAKETMLALLQ